MEVLFTLFSANGNMISMSLAHSHVCNSFHHCIYYIESSFLFLKISTVDMPYWTTTPILSLSFSWWSIYFFGQNSLVSWYYDISHTLFFFCFWNFTSFVILTQVVFFPSLIVWYFCDLNKKYSKVTESQ